MESRIREPKLLPVGPMARRIRVSVAWLREEAEAGRVPCLKAGKVFLFAPDAVETVLEKRAKQKAVIAPKLLTQYEAADVLALTPRQVVRLASRGELPKVIFPNGEIRFDPDDLAEWIELHKHPARVVPQDEQSDA
jgi:hypothetical protein